MSVAESVKRAIKNKKAGEVFAINSLTVFAAYKEAVEKSLSRMVQEGEIERIRRGIYYKPKKSKYFGTVPPSAEKVAQAIARYNKAHIIPYGPMALNELGLTTQVPVKLVYLSDKLHKTEKIGNKEIVFKRVSPKKVSFLSKKVGLIFSAIEYLGKEGLSDQKTVMKLKKYINNKLSKKEKEELFIKSKNFSKWIQLFIEKEIYELYF